MISSIRKFLGKPAGPTEKSAVEAYDIWSGSYDHQPGNLMLELDGLIFSELLHEVDLKNKKVADVGCGTGRHWQKLYDQEPGLLAGFDVSEGMLEQLKQKFPEAMTIKTTDNRLEMVSDNFMDCMVSTLTVAHIQDIEEVIAAWSRVLATNGDLIITDFHPDTLAEGGKRSFRHEGKNLSVTNYVHKVEKIISILTQHGFELMKRKEKYVDENVRSWYERQDALPVYNRFRGMPIIYGLHLKKMDEAR